MPGAGPTSCATSRRACGPDEPGRKSPAKRTHDKRRAMTRLHHVNLGVPEDGADAEAEFLVAVLGYRKVEPSAMAQGFGARWYETDDGTQVHLSPDPDHRPAARAPTALEIGEELEVVAGRLRDAGVEFGDNEFDGRRILFCQDPAGNRWELRGDG